MILKEGKGCGGLPDFEPGFWESMAALAVLVVVMAMAWILMP